MSNLTTYQSRYTEAELAANELLRFQDQQCRLFAEACPCLIPRLCHQPELPMPVRKVFLALGIAVLDVAMSTMTISFPKTWTKVMIGFDGVICDAEEDIIIQFHYEPFLGGGVDSYFWVSEKAIHLTQMCDWKVNSVVTDNLLMLGCPR